jgi:hypothetical protein
MSAKHKTTNGAFKSTGKTRNSPTTAKKRAVGSGKIAAELSGLLPDLEALYKDVHSHPGLWLCMAHVLKDIPQYRVQARTAAENALTCLREPLQQPPRVTRSDVEPIPKELS